MKIDGLKLPAFQPVETSGKFESPKKDFSKVINLRENSSGGVELPRNLNKEIVENFAEWYFRQGQTYERIKSYKQAISAYEKANSVQPDYNKVSSIESAREKAYSIKKQGAF
jgi:tetratricopeptide (TPR) repeat protein